MRLDFCMTTLQNLPTGTAAPLGGDVYRALAGAGYGGVQTHSMRGVAEAGLVGTALALVAEPEAVDAVARTNAAEGFACTTLIAGNGLEDEETIARFCAAIVEAAARHSHPLLLETHRGSITQDIRRTLDMIGRFPELRFNADFSHWYVGHELALGDFSAKLEALAPLIERADLVEGRIGSCNQAQLALEGADDARPFVAHHRAFWTRCFAASLARGATPVFAPQLLPAVLQAGGIDWAIGYAVEAREADGAWREQSDRWQQSLLLCAIARDCLREAQACAGMRN